MRFGLGPKAGELQAVSGDPRAAFVGMAGPSHSASAGAPPIDDLSAAMRSCVEWNGRRKDAMTRLAAKGGENVREETRKEVGPNCFGEAYDKEAEARLRRAVATDNPFNERLLQFWSNHFTVSAKNVLLQLGAGYYERDAIRPHVLGRFRDMLHAAVKHPAMLVYLDNQRSIGPNSPAGGLKRGLNENLAREILELHTLGVDGGYGQEDVTNLARILTGWTVTTNREDEPFRFRYAPRQHEPGTWAVLGRRFADKGQAQGEAVLDMLASHPSTARNVARRMCRHFVSENPPEPLVRRLAEVFRATDGDLAALARALVGSDEAWTEQRVKVLPPYDFVVAALRATGADVPYPLLKRTLQSLGQPLWRAPSPEGWPDENEAWAAPDALNERIDWAQALARRLPDLDVPPLAEAVLGSTLGGHEREAIGRAESRDQALAMFLMLPHFQRR